MPRAMSVERGPDDSLAELSAAVESVDPKGSDRWRADRAGAHASECYLDAPTSRQHHAPVRVFTHIKSLVDWFGDFLVGSSAHAAPAWRYRLSRSGQRAKLGVQ